MVIAGQISFLLSMELLQVFEPDCLAIYYQVHFQHFHLQRRLGLHQHQAIPQFSVLLFWLLLALIHGSLISGGAFEV